MAADGNLVDLTTAQRIFYDRADYEYQNRQYLAGIGQDHDMVGTSLEIPVVGTIEMQDRGFTSGDLAVQSITSRGVLIEPCDFFAKSTVGDSNETLFAYDKIDSWAKAHIKGAARKVDVVKLGAITGGTYSVGAGNQVPKNTATGTSTGFTISQLVEAQTLLEDNGYDMLDDMFLVGNVKGVKNIFQDQQFTDWDFRPGRPFAESPVDQFDNLMGVSVRKLGSQGSNKIDVAGDQDTSSIYLIAGEAMANGYNKRLHSAIVSEPWNLRTSIVTGLTMGSKIVHPTGIIEIIADQIPLTN